MVLGSIPGIEKRVFCSPKRLDQLCGLTPSLVFIVFPGCFPGLKRLGREVGHSPLSSAEVKNEWRDTFTPLYTFML
jgi:hypothetical protein